VVQTTGDPGDKIVPSPGRGVGSNVTFDDLSDGIPRIVESLTEGRENSESQKDFTEGNKGNKGCDLRPFAYLRFLLLVLSARALL
jgi:hypothetical protein